MINSLYTYCGSVVYLSLFVCFLVLSNQNYIKDACFDIAAMTSDVFFPAPEMAPVFLISLIVFPVRITPRPERRCVFVHEVVFYLFVFVFKGGSAKQTLRRHRQEWPRRLMLLADQGCNSSDGGISKTRKSNPMALRV